MFVADAFLDNGFNYAVCSGSGITKDMHINKILVDGSEFHVAKNNIIPSFIGELQAILIVHGTKLVPKGEVTILC